MDQTKFLHRQLCCMKVHDNKAADNPMKSRDIDNWYHHIMKFALRSKEWNNKAARFQSKRILIPELLSYSHDVRLPNHFIQTTRINDTLPILIQAWPFYLHGLTLIPTWINNHMPSKVWVEITYPLPNFNSATVEVWEWISNFIPHF